ncbi:6581_t:CDS:2, partial [Entrophospora sp. SA101]
DNTKKCDFKQDPKVKVQEVGNNLFSDEINLINDDHIYNTELANSNFYVHTRKPSNPQPLYEIVCHCCSSNSGSSTYNSSKSFLVQLFNEIPKSSGFHSLSISKKSKESLHTYDCADTILSVSSDVAMVSIFLR